MPSKNIAGGGRDSAFPIPQYFADLKGHKTAFCDSGGEGPVLFFVHGLAGNLTHWVHVAPAFVGEYRVVGVDLYGCGESERRKDRYSIGMYAEQVLGLMDLLQIGRATLVGHSLGGMVLTDLILAQPHRAERVVMVNPAGFLAIPRLVRGLGRLVLRRRLLNLLLPRLWKLVLANVFYSDNSYTRHFVEVQEQTYDPLTDIFDVTRVMTDLRREVLRRNYMTLLPQVAVPVHVIWGEKDRLVPAPELRRAASRLPDATLREISNVGHMPIIEVPEEVVAFLREALAIRSEAA